jgi:hypothetical protein
MKASDLQVGDLVTNNGGVIKVSAVHTKKIGYHKTKYKLNWLFSGQFEPIPLTKEILENNDILYRKSSFYYIINDDKDLECTHYIYQTIQEDWAIGVDIGAYECSVFARIKYVHELQHALKLCGIEKEIVV